MSDNKINQGKEEVKEIFYLHELQPELIEAKSTLEKVLAALCKDDNLAEEIRKASGDAATTSIWYLSQVIKYLEKIIANNQTILDAKSGKFTF
jgi:hypothetical protein